MGLAIMVAAQAYENYVSDDRSDDELFERPDLVYIYNLDEFEEHQDGARDGFYKHDGVGGFLSLSYSSYGALREWISGTCLDMPIAQVWADPEAAEQAVIEKFGSKAAGIIKLLNFADNEGAIGPVTADAIHDGLVARRGAAMLSDGDAWLKENYDSLIQGFETAATTNGFVVFA
jgi:hypothetical protein